VSGDTQLTNLTVQELYTTHIDAYGITAQALEATVSHHQVLRADRAILDRALINTKLVLPPTILQPVGATCYMAPQIVAGSTDASLLLDDYALTVVGDGRVTGNLVVWNLDVLNTISPPPNAEFKYVWAREFATETLAVGTTDLVPDGSPFVLDVSGVSRFLDSITGIDATFSGEVTVQGLFTSVDASMNTAQVALLTVGGATIDSLKCNTGSVTSLHATDFQFTDASGEALDVSGLAFVDASGGALHVGAVTIESGVATLQTLDVSEAQISTLAAKTVAVQTLDVSNAVFRDMSGASLYVGAATIETLDVSSVRFDSASIAAGTAATLSITTLDVSSFDFGDASGSSVAAGSAEIGTLDVSNATFVIASGDSLVVKTIVAEVGSIQQADISTGTFGDLSGSTLQVGDAVIQELNASSAALTAVDISAGSFGDLSGSTLRFGSGTATSLLATDATLQVVDISAGTFRDLSGGALRFGSATGSTLQVGVATLQTVNISGGVFTDLSGGVLRFGSGTATSLRATGATLQAVDISAGTFKDLSGGALRFGTATGSTLQIGAATIQTVNISGGVFTDMSGGSLRFGSATGSTLQVGAVDISAGTFKDLSSGALRFGSGSGATLQVGSATIQALTAPMGTFTAVNISGGVFTDMSGGSLRFGSATGSTLQVGAVTAAGASLQSADISAGTFKDLSGATLRFGSGSGATLQVGSATIQALTAPSASFSAVNISGGVFTDMSGSTLNAQTIVATSMEITDTSAGSAFIGNLTAGSVETALLDCSNATITGTAKLQFVNGSNGYFEHLFVQNLTRGVLDDELEINNLVVGMRIMDSNYIDLENYVLDVSGDSNFAGSLVITGGVTAGGPLNAASITTGGSVVASGALNGASLNVGSGSIQGGPLTLKAGSYSVTLASSDQTNNYLYIPNVDINSKSLTLSGGTLFAATSYQQRINTYSDNLLTINGKVDILSGAGGITTTPSLYWGDDADTGISHPSDGVLRISSNGTNRLEVNTSGVAVAGTLDTSGKLRLGDNGSAGTPTIIWPRGGIDVDSGLYSAGDGNIRTSINGVDRLEVNGAGVNITGNLTCSGTISGSFIVRFPVVTL
jgi:hypothetical protein